MRFSRTSIKEKPTELPDQGFPVRTELYALNTRGVWSVPNKRTLECTLFWMTWRYPTVLLWKKTKKNDDHFYREEDIFKYLLLDCSFIRPLSFENNHLSEETYQRIMSYSPAMIPLTLVKDFITQSTLSQAESLRIERECYSLWTHEGSSVKNPHPILAEVIWAMTLHEKFGIQSLPNFQDLHIKTYFVIHKAIECYSQAQTLNVQAAEQRRRAQQLSGVGPGGKYSR